MTRRGICILQVEVLVKVEMKWDDNKQQLYSSVGNSRRVTHASTRFNSICVGQLQGPFDILSVVPVDSLGRDIPIEGMTTQFPT